MARYFIKTFGCKVNQVESDELHAALDSIDAYSVDFLEDADFVIVNTCTVTGEADRKVRKELRKAARIESVLAVIVTGCSAVLLQKELRALDEKIFVLADRSEIPAFIARMSEAMFLPDVYGRLSAEEADEQCSGQLTSSSLRSVRKSVQGTVSLTPLAFSHCCGAHNHSQRVAERPEHRSSTSSATPSKIAESGNNVLERGRVRVAVKVQDGCESFCSYCIVPFARGACSSVGADEVVGRVRELAGLGVKEVVLTGINLGNYSDGDCSGIAALLGRLQVETDIYRVRLSSIEPRDVADELLEFMRPSVEGSKPLLCEHLHIPLQSGSDYVLGEMNRSYTAADFRELVRRIRQVNPHTAITTDIIAGYPCEDEEDFQQTLDLVQEINFAKIHVFRYSSREGTAAASLKPLDPQQIKQRVQKLQELADQQSANFKQQLTGKKLELIIETVNTSTNTATGTTREYLRLTLPSKNYNPGEIITFEFHPTPNP